MNSIDKRLVFYEGKYVLLKVLTEDDLQNSNWVGWFNDPQLCRFNQHHYYPNTFESQKKVFADCISPGKIQLGIVDKARAESICGIVSLQSINLLHRNAEIAGFQDERITSDRPEVFWEAWALMLRHAFDEMGLYKVYGGSFHPHVASALQRMLGFEIEGCRKQHIYKSGSFHDVTLIAVFRDTFSYPEF